MPIYKTGRSRTITSHSAISISCTLVWGWSVATQFDYPGIIGTNEFIGGGCPDFWITDNSGVLMPDGNPEGATLYFGALSSGRCTYKTHHPGGDPQYTVFDSVVVHGNILVLAGFPYSGYAFFQGTIPESAIVARVPYNEEFFYDKVPNSPTFGQITPPLPPINQTQWTAQKFTYSNAAVDHTFVTEEWMEKKASGNVYFSEQTVSATLKVTTPMGVWNIPSANYSPGSLGFETISVVASNNYGGRDAYLPDIDEFNKNGPLLSQGAEASNIPLWTCGFPNPDVPSWGVVSCQPATRGHDNYDSIDYGTGVPPHSLTIIADTVNCDGAPDMDPTDINISFAEYYQFSEPGGGNTGKGYRNTRAVSGYSVTKSIGGYYMFKNGKAIFGSLTDEQVEKVADATARHSIYGLGSFSYGASVYLNQGQGGFFATGTFAVRLWQPFDSVKIHQPGSVTYWSAPFALGAGLGQWEGLTGSGYYVYPVADVNVGLANDGSGNLRISVPVGGTTRATASWIDTYPNRPGLPDLTRYFPVPISRNITVRFRTVGSAGRSLTLSLVGFGQSLVTAAFPLTSGKDGEWVTASFDALNPAYAVSVGDTPYLDRGLQPEGSSSYASLPLYQGFHTTRFISSDSGAIFEVASVTGSWSREVVTSVSRGSHIACVADGMLSLNTVPRFDSYIRGFVTEINGAPTEPYYVVPAAVPKILTVTDLAPVTPGKGSYGALPPISQVFQNDLTQDCLGGSGLIDTSGTGLGAYKLWWDQVVTPASDGSANLTIPAQIVAVSVGWYPGCGDLMTPGGNYGFSTTLRFSAVSRSNTMATVYGRKPGDVLMIDSANGAEYERGTPLPSGYVVAHGKGVQPIDPVRAVSPKGDLTSSLGLGKTVAFPALMDTAILFRPLTPLANHLPGSTGVGPGGSEYQFPIAGYRAFTLLYASGKIVRSQPRNLSNPHTGEYLRIWCDTATNRIVFRGAAAVPDAAALWHSPVTVAQGDAASTVSHPGAFLDVSTRLWSIWQQDGATTAVYEAYSDDNGATWSAGVMVGTGSLPIYAGTEAGGIGQRIPARFVASSTDASGMTGTVVVTPTPAGIAASGASDKTALQVIAGVASPLLVTDSGFDIVQGHEGANRLVLVCTVAGETAISEWACADETGWTFARLPTPA